MKVLPITKGLVLQSATRWRWLVFFIRHTLSSSLLHDTTLPLLLFSVFSSDLSNTLNFPKYENGCEWLTSHARQCACVVPARALSRSNLCREAFCPSQAPSCQQSLAPFARSSKQFVARTFHGRPMLSCKKIVATRTPLTSYLQHLQSWEPTFLSMANLGFSPLPAFCTSREQCLGAGLGSHGISKMV